MQNKRYPDSIFDSFFFHSRLYLTFVEIRALVCSKNTDIEKLTMTTNIFAACQVFQRQYHIRRANFRIAKRPRSLQQY